MSQSTTEQISYSTVRIEALNEVGQLISTGSGFIVDLEDNDPENIRPVFVTNKHVINGAHYFRIFMCTMDENNIVNDTDHYQIHSNFQWTMHPEDDVDLCVLPMAPFVHKAKSEGVNLYYKILGLDLIPTTEQTKQIDVVENIMMVGYPIGLWDSTNNKPIFRQGITATDYTKDYCGKKEFLIDCACFPGSSGSPIFLLNSGMYTPRSGGSIMGAQRMHLLGILYAGPQFTAQGQLTVVNIPTAQTAIVSSSIPSNIGIIIKSEKLLDFKKLIN